MLDRSLDVVKFFPSIMSFRRKWVSDTNLSKLLHETIEKKQANKKSKLPDFCKDAILSATIKKISSAMVINRNVPMCEKDGHFMDCDGKNGTDSEDKAQNLFTDDGIVDRDSWDDELDTPICMNFDNLEIDPDLSDDDMSMVNIGKSRTEWRNARPPLCRQSSCASPKRKRQPSSESTEGGLTYTNLDTVAPQASPSKRRREYLMTKSETLTPDIEIFDEISFSSNLLHDEEVSDMHLPNNHIRGQRSQSLPHLSSFLSKDDIEVISSKNNFPSPKSVVNSISELSIRDCWEPAKDGSWSYPKNENVEPDPLELNGFFQELKSVTVHPN